MTGCDGVIGVFLEANRIDLLTESLLSNEPRKHTHSFEVSGRFHRDRGELPR